jgi:predicted nucleic acid-binding protein
MTPCVADTFYFLALLNSDDEAHQRTMALAAMLRRPIVTTHWVLAEVGDALAPPATRGLFRPFLERLRKDPRTTIALPSDALFNRGVALYAEREDKGWSLTDCISFVVMADGAMTEALTGDHHFTQAGFTALLA